jgi:L-rhamnose mutarotase
MPCVCFSMFVAPEKMRRYLDMHANPWPELLVALRDSGWRNYSLFLRPDGLLIGYWESADPAASMSAMSGTAVSARWSVEMDQLVVPGTSMRFLENTRTRGKSGRPKVNRAVSVGTSALELGGQSDAAGYLAEFCDDRQILRYAETESPSNAQGSPFVEVFNLELLLATLL